VVAHSFEFIVPVDEVEVVVAVGGAFDGTVGLEVVPRVGSASHRE
jgi:hypothetical protein